MSNRISARPVKLAIAITAVVGGLVTTAGTAALASGTSVAATTTHVVMISDNNPWPLPVPSPKG